MTFAQEINAAADTVRDRQPLGPALADLLAASAAGMETFGHVDHNALRLAREINELAAQDKAEAACAHV